LHEGVNKYWKVNDEKPLNVIHKVKEILKNNLKAPSSER